MHATVSIMRYFLFLKPSSQALVWVRLEYLWLGYFWTRAMKTLLDSLLDILQSPLPTFVVRPTDNCSLKEH